jgi:hypothetical protein
LNSKLITKYCIEKEIIKIKEGKTPQIRSGQRGPLGIRQIPIKEISENDSCKKIIKNVLEILRLNQERDKTKLETKINQLQNKIDYCEEKINECVYELYNLTEEQIELVESD